MENWYWFKADWSLDASQGGLPYCTWYHMGLKFDLICHNVMFDLKGWWTLNGQPVPGVNANGGYVPILGFMVQDIPTPDPADSQVVRILLGDADGEPEAGEIQTEIVSMSLASVPPEMINFGDLRRDNPAEQQLPWVEVVHRENGIPLSQAPIRLGGGDFQVDSFFDVWTEIDIPDSGDGTPGFVLAEALTIAPGNILVIRQEVQFTDNTGAQSEKHWFWEWHEAHPAQHDLGDAPDSSNSWSSPLTGLTYPMTAYPWGVQGRYPTVFAAGSPAFGPIHWFPRQGAFLGRNVTVEREADIGPDQDPTNNIIPTWDRANRDLADDGVLNLPLFLPHCTPTTFQFVVTINQPIDYFVNVWFDWNRDGDWDDTMNCQAGAAGAPEHAVVDQHINLPPGMHNITSDQFNPWSPSGVPFNPNAILAYKLPIWMRITISEDKWRGSSDASGVGPIGGSGTGAGYVLGETEDYYFAPRTPCCPDYNADGFINLYDLAWFFSFWLQNCPPG